MSLFDRVKILKSKLSQACTHLERVSNSKLYDIPSYQMPNFDKTGLGYIEGLSSIPSTSKPLVPRAGFTPQSDNVKHEVLQPKVDKGKQV
jgi:hypothetical protein